MVSVAEYIWLDGSSPTQRTRSKSRVLNLYGDVTLDSFPEWSYDGSSTYQASGQASDLILKPACFVDDPIRGPGSFLVFCEVWNSDNTPHSTNKRVKLQTLMELGGAAHDPFFGFEQEFTFFQGTHPLGWPENGYPEPQGPFYCGVGQGRVFGREIVEEHVEACIEAGIMISGINAEVMPGQWEFQVGYRGFKSDPNNALAFCDHLWIARWLLERIAEDHNVVVSWENKPVHGDWNGAGCHANFSTKSMRDAETGRESMKKALELLEKKHAEHIAVYGHNLAERLTGLHETCAIDEFREGVSDRGASIRTPLHVDRKGYGYLEDRRPGANCDPYLVAARLIATICEFDDALLQSEPGLVVMS